MSSLPSALGSLPPHHLSKSGWFGPKYECHWAPGLTTKSLIDVCKWMQERKRFPGAGHLTDNKDPKPEDFE